MPSTPFAYTTKPTFRWSISSSAGYLMTGLGILLVGIHFLVALAAIPFAWYYVNFNTATTIRRAYAIVGSAEMLLLGVSAAAVFTQQKSAMSTQAVVAHMARAARPCILLVSWCLLSTPLLRDGAGTFSAGVITVVSLATLALTTGAFRCIRGLVRTLEAGVRFPHETTRTLGTDEDVYRRDRFGPAWDLPASLNHFPTARSYAKAAQEEAFSATWTGQLFTLLGGATLLSWGLTYFREVNTPEHWSIFAASGAFVLFLLGSYLNTRGASLRGIADEYWARCEVLASEEKANEQA